MPTSMASALPRGDLRVLEGMTHGLALVGSACGSAPVTPLHPLLVWTILAWLERVAPRGDAEPAGLCPVSAPVPAPSPPRGP